MKKYLSVCMLVSSLALAGCVDEWLTTEPQTILTDDQLWSDPGLVRGVIADYYDRIPQWEGLDNSQWPRWANMDEGLVTGQAQGGNSSANYGYGTWANWAGTGNGALPSWGLIRDLHVAMKGIENASGDMTPALKMQFHAELRFIRAMWYFEMVKRYGGVPLLTEELLYDFSGDPSYLHTPRATEAAIYDFIGAEMDEIMDQLGNAGSRTRANRYSALALKSRAMLYAGSLARHNGEMATPITLPGEEVGIPPSRAAEYYQKSLDASRALITSGAFALNTGANPADAFHQVFVNKSNPEVIMAKDYLAGAGKNHWFTMRGMPQSMKVDQYMNWAGSEISATLNVAETFDYLDGSSGEMRGVGDGTVASQANWIFYDRLDGIFEGKDQRLHGTLLTPGRTFAGNPVSLQAGVYVWNSNANRYDRFQGAAGTFYSDGGVLTGADGPLHQEAYVSGTGLYIKKWLDPAPGAGRYTPGSDTWWVWFRLGEIYMNATEAAFELGLHAEALGYINTLRQRAGFPPNSLTTLSREKIRSDRWAELAYEDHRIWDQKRWRTAHEVWDGNPTNPSARLYALFPYRVIHPGHPNHGKYVFDKFVSTLNAAPRFFRMGNYYTEITQGAINANPKLVRNPFH